MNVAFLDRDGTIIKDYPDKDWANVKYPEFLEGSIKTLKYIKSKNFETIIITNQYLIGEGIITLEEYMKFNNLFLKILNGNDVNILDVFYCPHARNQNCNCRKPNQYNNLAFQYESVVAGQQTQNLCPFPSRISANL